MHRADIELDDFDESIDEHLPGHRQRARRRSGWPPTCSAPTVPRRYLVLFTTPSESRGLGGFVGNYAELTIDDGHLSMTSFGRAEDLDRLALQAGARVTGHEEFLRQYGRFGFDTDGNGPGRRRRLPQPGDDAELPVGRGDRRRPLRPDDRP